MAWRERFAVAVMVVLSLTSAPGDEAARAQTKPREPARTAAPLRPEVAPAPVHIVIPDAQGLAILIDNVIVALGQANLTGNYTVLRELGAPDFQKLNSPQRLAMIFADLRARDINLSPIVLFQPKLAQQPSIDDNGFLRLVGFYETQPLQVHFNLLFQPVSGSWRLYEISVWTAIIR